MAVLSADMDMLGLSDLSVSCSEGLSSYMYALGQVLALVQTSA